MKQFIVILIDELGIVKLENIRLIPAENERDAINLYSNLPLFKNSEFGSTPTVIGYMEYKDGYPSPVFTHDLIMTTRKEFQVRPAPISKEALVPVTLRDPVIENKKSDISPERKTFIPSETKKESFQKKDKKLYLVGAYNYINPEIIPFLSGTTMAIEAEDVCEACIMYSIESANYIESNSIIAIEVLCGKNEIVVSNGYVENDPTIGVMGIYDNSNNETLHWKAIIFPNAFEPSHSVSAQSALIKTLTSTCLNSYHLYLEMNDLLEEFKKDDNFSTMITILSKGSEIWLKR